MESEQFESVKADAIERGGMRGYISDIDGYPASLDTKIEQIDWNQIKMGEE